MLFHLSTSAASALVSEVAHLPWAMSIVPSVIPQITSPGQSPSLNDSTGFCKVPRSLQRLASITRGNTPTRGLAVVSGLGIQAWVRINQSPCSILLIYPSPTSRDVLAKPQLLFSSSFENIFHKPRSCMLAVFGVHHHHEEQKRHGSSNDPSTWCPSAKVNPCPDC